MALCISIPDKREMLSPKIIDRKRGSFDLGNKGKHR